MSCPVDFADVTNTCMAKADPNNPSTYLGEEPEPDPYDIPFPDGFDRRRSTPATDSK